MPNVADLFMVDGVPILYGNEIGYVNAKQYGAKGDGRIITAVTPGASVATVTAPSGTFSSLDVGRSCFLSWHGANVSHGMRTILSVNTDGSQCTLDDVWPHSAVSCHMYIGTNDTSALKAAWAAAVKSKRSLYCPAGVYLFNRQIVGWFSSSAFPSTETDLKSGIIGDGAKETVFIMMPDWSSSGMVTGGGNGAAVNIYGTYGLRCGGFTVDCANVAQYGINDSVVSIESSAGNYAGSSFIHDIAVRNVRGSSITAGIRLGALGGGARFEGIWAYDVTAIYGISWVNCGVGTSIRNSGSSNCTAIGQLFYAVDGVVIGGYQDECENESVSIQESTVNFIDYRVWGGVPAYVLTVYNSTVRMDQCQVFPFGLHADTDAVFVDSTSKLYLRDCLVIGTGTGVAIAGSGTLYDLGGNSIKRVENAAPNNEVSGAITVANAFGEQTESTPASASASGLKGQMRYDANYVYVCTAPNTWKRSPLSTW